MILSQKKLNIEGRSRTSRLPWRGQFSPEFIEYLMGTVCADSRSFLDPFCGSGTVLFEASQRGCASWGLEVNPAAWLLASLAEFSKLSSSNQALALQKIKSVIASYSLENCKRNTKIIPSKKIIEDIISEPKPWLSKILSAAILLGMGNQKDLTYATLAKGAFGVAGILNEMSNSSMGEATCLLADARHIPLKDKSVEAVITSPPYINVFNYHQNYRPAIELLGWNPLEAARSEIGSNRKHRMNRFLTVAQYCMDMAVSLGELSRVMKTGAPIVIVLGRTSNVLGCSFENGRLIKEIMLESGAFDKFKYSERVFTSRFGEKIYEDIIVAHQKKKVSFDINSAKAIGIDALKRNLKKVSETNKHALNQAIENAHSIKLSPPLQLIIPIEFQDLISKKKEHNANYTSSSARG